MNTTSFIKSAFLAGLAIGLLGNLPVLNFVNCLLCLWVWVGGLLAVLLYRRSERAAPGLTPGQGAGLGALAGLFGTLVGVVVYAMFSFITMPMMDSLARFLEVEGDLPFQQGGLQGVGVTSLFFCMVNIVLYPLFGALSGLISASYFQRKTQT